MSRAEGRRIPAFAREPGLGSQVAPSTTRLNQGVGETGRMIDTEAGTMSCPALRPRVLAVDDDRSILEALRLILEERYDVLEARNGDTALTLVQSQPVDLVLLDILIEGIDRSEEHTSELQSQSNLVCRLLLEKKKKYT